MHIDLGEELAKLPLEEDCLYCDGEDCFRCGGTGKRPTEFGKQVLALVERHFKRLMREAIGGTR